MAMASGFSLKFPWRIFLLILATSWITVVSFVAFQYMREKQYKTEQLNARMQLFNNFILNGLEDGRNIDSLINESHMPLPKTRVSLFDFEGNVKYDSSTDTLVNSNHITRPEIASAITTGSGYTTRRTSQSTGGTYFYSATAGDSVIIRSAAPYSISLLEVLEADRTFLGFMLAVTIIISAIGYIFSHKIGLTIMRLKTFAERAERGEQIYNNHPFPNDELGEIANRIVRLYAQLQFANAQNERQNRQILAQEQDKIRLKKELTNNINHELKTPVASIQVCLETLLDHSDLPEDKRREFLERCYSNTARLRNLLDDVSMITRMEDGNSVINKNDVDLYNIVNEMKPDLELLANEYGFKFTTNINHSLTMKGNEALLQSIFRNLFDNAIAYSGGDTIELRLIDNNESRISLIFADNGNGVPEEHISHIFERFFRVDKGRSRKIGGTGLGLAIVKNATLLHGGTISAENRISGGLAFRINLSRK